MVLNTKVCQECQLNAWLFALEDLHAVKVNYFYQHINKIGTNTYDKWEMKLYKRVIRVYCPKE